MLETWIVTDTHLTNLKESFFSFLLISNNSFKNIRNLLFPMIGMNLVCRNDIKYRRKETNTLANMLATWTRFPQYFYHHQTKSYQCFEICVQNWSFFTIVYCWATQSYNTQSVYKEWYIVLKGRIVCIQ